MSTDPAVLVAGRGWRDRRRTRWWWVFGLGLYSIMLLGVWPTVEGNDQFSELAEDYPEALMALFGGKEAFASITSPEGFTNTYYFSFMLPLLLMTFAATAAGSLLAGEDEGGQLELVLSQPVSRARVILAKAAVVVAGLLVLVSSVVIVLLVGGPMVGLHLGVGGLLAVALGSLLFGALHGAIAFAVGAATGRRGAAVGGAVVIGVAGYMISGFAEVTSWMEPVRYVLPMYHAKAADPLTNGIPVANYLLLFGVTALVQAGAVVLFKRHDLR